MSADDKKSGGGAGGGNDSAYYSAVKRIMSKLSPSTLRQFHQLASDDDRLAFVSALPDVRPALAAAGPRSSSPRPPVDRTGKSSEEAARRRQAGNELYKAERLRDALASYTASVLVAPVTDVDVHDDDRDAAEEPRRENAEKANAEFALALGNRSACLLQTKRYGDCLTDVALALRYGYPRHLRYKLYDRRARALIELGRFDEALEALRQLHGSLSLAALEPDQRGTVARNAEKKMDFCSSAVVQPPPPAPKAAVDSTNDEGPGAPAVCGADNERFPGASDAFDVRYHQDKGRYGVASRDVGVGEVLLVETPYVSVLSANAFELRCYNCFRTVGDIPLGCHTCTRVRYCSEECRKQSWETYHNVECRILGVLMQSGTGPMAHLTVKLLAVTGLARVLKCRRNPKSSSEALCQSLFTNSSGVYLGGYVSLYGLLSHSESRSPAELFQYTLLAVWLTDILYRTAFVDVGGGGGSDDKERALVGGVVLRFLQIVTCNGVEVTELRLSDTLHRSHPVSVGLALYPTVSLLNHACDPVLELVFYGDRCAVRAVQNARAGRELFIDYGHVYYVVGRAERRAALRRQYHFDCQCVACTLDWPLKSHLPSGAATLKCVGCGAALGAGQLAADPVECGLCRREQVGMADRLDVLATSQTAAEKAIGDARKFRVTRSTMSALEEHITLIDKYIQLPWKDYVVCLSTLKQCYRYLGNRRQS